MGIGSRADHMIFPVLGKWEQYEAYAVTRMLLYWPASRTPLGHGKAGCMLMCGILVVPEVYGH